MVSDWIDGYNPARTNMPIWLIAIVGNWWVGKERSINAAQALAERERLEKK
jgi:hypothetical protein